MSNLNPIGRFLIHNRYWIVVIVGVLIVGVLDENSFMKRVELELSLIHI